MRRDCNLYVTIVAHFCVAPLLCGSGMLAGMNTLPRSLTHTLKFALSKPLGAGGELRMTAALQGRHPAEIVEAMDGLTRAETLAVFNWLDNPRAAEVLDDLPPDMVRFLTDNAPSSRIADLLDHLPMDDAAEVISEASPQIAGSLLKDLEALAPADAAEVRSLLAYPDDSAGRLMTDKFARAAPDETAKEVLGYLRRSAGELETINEIYVTEPDGTLTGFFPLSAALAADAERRVRDFATPESVRIAPETDQKEAARLISRYDRLTLPITDPSGRILGILTIDDVVDVLVEEFNEEYLRTVGSDAEELEQKSPVQVAALRLPWIMATLGIELFAGVVIHGFDQTLTKFILLASFMPIISAISGNTGLQSAAIIIRGLSSGQVKLSEWRHALGRQVATTLILGGVCALTLGMIAGVWDRHWAFGLAVFLGMFLSVNIAGVIGTCIPMLSKRAGFDPALTAGPFETAFQDVVGISIFLSLASVLLRWLH